MSYTLYNEDMRKDGLHSVSYEFSTTDNDYIISFSRSHSKALSRRLYITRFDIKERVLVPFVRLAPQNTNEGVPFEVYENIAECVGAFYYGYKVHIDNILMKGILSPQMYEWLVNRYGPTYGLYKVPEALNTIIYDIP
jgi:hypothetical protein